MEGWFDMLGYWEYTLNKCVKKGGVTVTLDSILSNIDKKEQCFELSESHSAIRYINDAEYENDVYRYVEPNFNESKNNIGKTAKFILFSAPGATGKSALAKHICHTKNAIYWDLPENKIAEYSFQGAITEAVGYDYVSDFVKALVNGKIFFVIDAFDEAEAGSGRSGIEFFLRDLNDVTRNCVDTCAVLMARTESAIFIKEYCEKNNISYKHYEIGYFAEYNSKSYITNRLERSNINISKVVEECIEEQFKEIHRIFADKDATEFLGYAPVLDALAASYSDERNTSILLKNTTNGANNCQLMIKILNQLLEREQEKFKKALKNKFSKFEIAVDSNKIYSKEEQLKRIIGKLLFDDPIIFVQIDQCVPYEYHEEYLEVVNTQLPQHPFIFSKEIDGKVFYEFTGPAFRDFVIAFGLADLDMNEFVREILADNRKYCPSQMLIEYYEVFTKKKLKGSDIPLMYSSFKAHAHLGDTVTLNISGDKNECYTEFCLMRSGKNILNIELELVEFEDGLYINQITNCHIDIAGKVYVGNINGEARINNSTIVCDELIWCSEKVLLEAYSPGECILMADKLTSLSNVTPRFEVKLDKKNNMKVCANNIGSYYKLLAYKSEEVSEVEEASFTMFSNIVRRIFSCLRSHSKDTPARKMDFIDNRIVGSSQKKKEILQFFLSNKILYTDEQDWLYKLDTDKVSQFEIMWNEVKQGEFNSLKRLYSAYKEN